MRNVVKRHTGFTEHSFKNTAIYFMFLLSRESITHFGKCIFCICMYTSEWLSLYPGSDRHSPEQSERGCTLQPLQRLQKTEMESSGSEGWDAHGAGFAPAIWVPCKSLMKKRTALLTLWRSDMKTTDTICAWMLSKKGHKDSERWCVEVSRHSKTDKWIDLFTHSHSSQSGVTSVWCLDR